MLAYAIYIFLSPEQFISKCLFSGELGPSASILRQGFQGKSLRRKCMFYTNPCNCVEFIPPSEKLIPRWFDGACMREKSMLPDY